MLTPQQLKAREDAKRDIAKGPKGYFWALHAIGATPEQLAVVKHADEEIKALKALIFKLGGGVL